VNCEENIFTIEFIEGKFDLSTMPEGFDITKVSEWHNGTVNGTILSIIDRQRISHIRIPLAMVKQRFSH
jgi:hypothetical protein